MMDIREELNAPPKRRITIPEGSVAVILPKQFAEDVIGMCFRVRRGRRLAADEKQAMHKIAGDLLLAIVEAIDGQ